MKTILLMLIVLFGCAGLASAASVNLGWTGNTETDLKEYNLYQAPGSCTNPGAFAKVSTFPKTAVTGSVVVTADGTYCFRETAVDTANNESLFSNTAQAVVNLNPPAAPANLQVLGVTP